MWTLKCFTVREAKVGGQQRAGGSSFPPATSRPLSPPSPPPVWGNHLHSSAESINCEENKRSPRQFEAALITARGLVLHRRPSQQQLRRPGPAPKLSWEGWWERQGFCSAGASCAPLMMAAGASSWLIAAQPSASLPAFSPDYPAAGPGPGAGTRRPSVRLPAGLQGSQTMSGFCGQRPPAAGDAACN